MNRFLPYLLAALVAALPGYYLGDLVLKKSSVRDTRATSDGRLTSLGNAIPLKGVPPFAKTALFEITKLPPEKQLAAVARMWREINDPGEIKTLLNLNGTLPPRCQSAAIAILLKNWMESEPAEACRWAGNSIERWYERCLHHWAEKDFDAALEFAKTSEDPGAAVSAILEKLSESDPERAFQLLFTAQFDSYASVISNYVKSLDPEEALRQAEALKGMAGHSFSNYMKGRALEAWAAKSPGKALAWWFEAPDRQSLTDEIFDHLPPAAWDDALDAARSLPDEEWREIISDVYYDWSRQDPITALETFVRHDAFEGAQSHVFRNTIAYVARVDPALAASHFEWKDSSSDYTAHLIEENLRREDPAAADRFLAGLTAEQQEALDKRQERDTAPLPATVDEFTERMLKQKEFNSYQFGALSSSERERFLSTLAAQSLEKRTVLADIVEDMHEEHPSMAAELLPLLPPEAAEKDGAKEEAAALAAHWARQSPREAADWVDRLPDGNLRRIAASNVVRQWKFFDEEAATAWASAFPDDATREAALSGLNDPW